MPIESARRNTAATASFVPPSSPPSPPTEPQGPEPASREPSPDRSRLLAARPPVVVGAGPASPTALRARLDAFRERFTPTYRIGDETVRVPAQFRMAGGNGPGVVAAGNRLLRELPKNALLPRDLNALACGRATPERLAMATQLLLDAGKLPPADDQHPTLALRVQEMQRQYGIGIDCAGYVQQAFLASRGATRERFGFAETWNENLMRVRKDPRFEAVSPLAARPGDLFSLDPPPRETVGHQLIVASHEVGVGAGHLVPPKGSEKELATFLMGGPIHAIEVDSSWGAFDVGLHGGVKRETWLYNETSRKWAWTGAVDVATGGEGTKLEVRFHVGDQPYAHPIGGVFRPRGESAA